MAILYDDASSQYAFRGSWTSVVAAPLTMAAWFKTDTVAINQFICGLSDTANNNDFFLLGLVSAQLNALMGDGAGNNAATVSAASANVWQHAAGVFASTTSRTAYLNGTAGAAETTARTPASIDTFAIGCHKDNVPDTFFSGLVANVAVWNVALTAPDIAALAAGVSPRSVRPDALVALYDSGAESLVGTTLLDRWVERLDLTTVAGPTASADHPNLLRPSGDS